MHTDPELPELLTQLPRKGETLTRTFALPLDIFAAISTSKLSYPRIGRQIKLDGSGKTIEAYQLAGPV
jgi:hypothetical protein